MRSWSPNIDENGLIVQSVSKDGGDTPINTGMACLGRYLSPKQLDGLHKLAEEDKLLNKLMCGCGNRFRRHPNTVSPHSECDRGTRDQATGIIVIMLIGVLKGIVKKRTVFKFLWEVFKFKPEIFGSKHKATWLVLFMRTFNFTNWREQVGSPLTGKSTPDFSNFMLFSIGLRAIGGWWLWPLYSILDFEIFVAAILERFSDTDKVQPHIVRSLIAAKIYPTIFGRLAHRINDYGKLYDKTVTFFKRATSSGDQGPPMYQLYTKEMMED